MLKFLIGLLLCFSAYAKPKTLVLTESNSVSFNQQVTEAFVSEKIVEILEKAKKNKSLFLVMNTPGGSVTSGLKLIDVVKGLNIPVHTLTIFAASMGYQIVQELDNRYILSSGMLMSHRGSVSGIGGQIPGELNSRINMITQLLDRMSRKSSERVGISKQAYEKLIINELWLAGENAVSKNHADEVVSAVCDASLLTTFTKTYITFFGNAVVTFSNCPLVSGPLKIEFAKNVKKENYNKIMKFIKSKHSNIYLNF